MAKEVKIQVKVSLLAAELRLLRLGAASRNLTTTGFLRQTALAAAADEMRSFEPPCAATGEKSGQKAPRDSETR